MKRYYPLVAVALTIASSKTALADTLTGTINWVNPYGQQMLVDRYHWFILAPGADTTAVQVGNRVNLTYSERAGQNVVTKASPAASKRG